MFARIARMIADFLATRHARKVDRAPSDVRPADGVVEVAATSGIEGVANSVDARWRRYKNLVDETIERDRPRKRPAMLGRVVFFSVFVGRDGRSWTDSEIAAGHESLINAGTWIEREAMRLGVSMNVELADTYFVTEDESAEAVEIEFVAEGEDVGPMEAYASERYLAAASRAASRFGFADVCAMMTTVAGRVVADGYAWLFHQKSQGRSIAVDGEDFGLTGVCLAVCFSREASFPEPLVGPARVDPTTIAHEVLHLFGATDKYGIPLRSFGRDSVTTRDVMRLSHDRLSMLTIGPLTAREIGWAVAGDEKAAATR